MDKEIFHLIELEEKRQQEHVELIASENFVSEDVLKAAGSILTNKYAEGYPNHRYYGGCEIVDQVELLAIKRLTKIFNIKYANVQPHSGSQANVAAYAAVLKPGDTILGMALDAGGHLTHGYPVSFSGTVYKAFNYGVNKDTHLIDYDEVLKIALEVKPKLIICGASAYSRIIDFKKFRQIADKVGAYLLADVAHIAGLIVANEHPSPVNHAHIITSTTHKTLRGPRGGIILTNDKELAAKIDKAIFPHSQGGPLMHIIAAKAIAFKEADSIQFINYIKQVKRNAFVFAEQFKKLNYKLVANGTDNHLFIIDVKSKLNLTGQVAEDTLLKINIICNKNTIPNDTEKPTITSGIRLGTPAMTTKGFNENDFIKLANLIDQGLRNYQNEKELVKIKVEVLNLLNEKRVG